MHRSTGAAALRVAVLAGVAALAGMASIAAAGRRDPAQAAARTKTATRSACRRVAAVQAASRRSTRRLADLPAPERTVKLATPLRVTPPLGQGGYVFPLPGPYPEFPDTFGAPRADVGGHWHHGDDLFAPRGTPVLAVADGIVYSVGWNHIGGWRMWLRDRSGNQFYYAHLDRYAPLAVDGRRVAAGQLLGYVGTSGDAVNTPPHLFFEINPSSLSGLGYDGTVDPTGYLRRWPQLRAPRPAPPVRRTLARPAPKPACTAGSSSCSATAPASETTSTCSSSGLRRYSFCCGSK